MELRTCAFTNLLNNPTPYHFHTLFTPPIIRDPLQFQAWVENWGLISLGCNTVEPSYDVPIANAYMRDSRVLAIYSFSFAIPTWMDGDKSGYWFCFNSHCRMILSYTGREKARVGVLSVERSSCARCGISTTSRTCFATHTWALLRMSDGNSLSTCFGREANAWIAWVLLHQSVPPKAVTMRYVQEGVSSHGQAEETLMTTVFHNHEGVAVLAGKEGFPLHLSRFLPRSLLV